MIFDTQYCYGLFNGTIYLANKQILIVSKKPHKILKELTFKVLKDFKRTNILKEYSIHPSLFLIWLSKKVICVTSQCLLAV